MGIIKASKTQRGDSNYIFECQCGCSMIRLCKNTFDDIDNPIHAFEIWECRGDTNWSIWKRISLAFRILIGKEAKFATSEVLFENDDVEPLANAILSLKKSA